MDSQASDITTSHIQRAMLASCASGDLPTLQVLLKATKLQLGNVREPGLPTIHSLLTSAISAKQSKIVIFLLQKYPSLSLSQQIGIVQAVLDNPDAAILQVLSTHDPSFPSFSIDDGLRCFITDACSRPPEQIVPVLHVLIDNGADLNDGWGPGGGALFAAVLGGQPLEIVEKMVGRGAWVSCRVVCAAVNKVRIDVLEYLFRSKRMDGKIQSEELIERARKGGNEEVIAIVERLTGEREAQMSRSRRTGERNGWWQAWNCRK